MIYLHPVPFLFHKISFAKNLGLAVVDLSVCLVSLLKQFFVSHLLDPFFTHKLNFHWSLSSTYAPYSLNLEVVTDTPILLGNYLKFPE